MSETIPQLPKTQLDQVFAITGAELFEDAEQPTLELIAAKINSYDLFVVGPQNAINDHSTHLERVDQQLVMEGKPPLYMCRINVGEMTQERIDVNAQNEPADIRAANVLVAIGQYDPVFAAKLLKPVARELLVQRDLLTTGNVAVSVRPKQDVEDMIQRLEIFANSGLDATHARVFKDLASVLRSESQVFELEERAVISATAARREVRRVREARLSRWAFRVGGAACAAVAALAAYVAASVNDSNVKYENRLGIFASSEETEFTNYDLLLEQPDLTPDQRQEIIDTEVLQLELDKRAIATIQPAEGNQTQIELQKRLSDDTQQAIDSIKSEQQAEPSSESLRADLENIAKHNVPGASESAIVEGEILLYGSAVVALIFAGSALYGASKRGGRMDPALKAYKLGQLTPTDITLSPSVNSSQKLGSRLSVGRQDSSVVIR